jgi:hypothetical protein
MQRDHHAYALDVSNLIWAIPLVSFLYSTFTERQTHIIYLDLICGYLKLVFICGLSLWWVGSDGNVLNKYYEEGFFDDNEGIPSHHVYPCFTTCMLFYCLKLYMLFYSNS